MLDLHFDKLRLHLLLLLLRHLQRHLELIHILPHDVHLLLRDVAELHRRLLQQTSQALSLVLPRCVLHLELNDVGEVLVTLQLTHLSVLLFDVSNQVLQFSFVQCRQTSLLPKLLDDVHADTLTSLVELNHLSQHTVPLHQLSLHAHETCLQLQRVLADGVGSRFHLPTLLLYRAHLVCTEAAHSGRATTSRRSLSWRGTGWPR
mmetsp:Transcript_23631/g.55077  ORF Transcript_23631/g.55077 Transcript_23631/m.55077 type:complete len:204 (-) Transcript_23631:273-884(-)